MISDVWNILSHRLKTDFLVFGDEINAQYFYKGEQDTLPNSQIKIRFQGKEIFLCQLSIGCLKLDWASFLEDMLIDQLA